MTGPAADSLAAALLAPTGRDGALAETCLRHAGVDATACVDFDELCARARAGVGALLVTEEALTPERVRLLAAVVQSQPAWSDLPIIVFSSRPDRLRSRSDLPLQELGNVSFIDRPVQRRTLVAAVRSALRGRQRQYEARRAITAREQFLAMLGHELRNPLAAILFATDLLGRNDGGRSTPAKHLATIERQTRHLNRLVDDLLDVARVTSGKVILKRERVDLVDLLARSIEAHQVMADAHGVTLAARTPPQPLLVDGDIVRLEQVTTNLLTNAIKYTPRGGEVRAALERDGDQAVLRVDDTGVGIPSEHLDSIFELFAQAPTTLDRARGGMGLGLTLVRALVELQGGTVAAHSGGAGRGSTFEIRLPLLDAGVSTAPRAETPAPTPPPAVRGKCVVVVDDNVDIRETLAELLALEGYIVEEAADGPQGLTRIIAARPDAALVDIGLPGFDGYELARRARRTFGDSLLLIAMTGYGQAEDHRRARDAGFDAHLTKPVSIETVAAMLRSCQGRLAATPAPPASPA
jgi:signal transduction histidine kinase/ActR/RegA family two-component response regulator